MWPSIMRAVDGVMSELWAACVPWVAAHSAGGAWSTGGAGVPLWQQQTVQVGRSAAAAALPSADDSNGSHALPTS
jgi:hypothetical protein